MALEQVHTPGYRRSGPPHTPLERLQDIFPDHIRHHDRRRAHLAFHWLRPRGLYGLCRARGTRRIRRRPGEGALKDKGASESHKGGPDAREAEVADDNLEDPEG